LTGAAWYARRNEEGGVLMEEEGRQPGIDARIDFGEQAKRTERRSASELHSPGTHEAGDEDSGGDDVDARARRAVRASMRRLTEDY
jgi:hypothetical protein